MTFVQMHERLRVELLRRIKRGALSVSLLARQTGFGQSHISNVLRSKRHLSLAGMDRILASQQMVVSDLEPSPSRDEWPWGEWNSNIPVVSQSVALCEPTIRTGWAQGVLHLPTAILRQARTRPARSHRRAWQRFVAVCVSAADAAPMEPVILPDALVLIDRHYNSLLPYRPDRASLLAVHHDGRLKLRYADFAVDRLILRPHNLSYPIELAQLGPDESPGDLIVGRAVLILNAL